MSKTDDLPELEPADAGHPQGAETPRLKDIIAAMGPGITVLLGITIVLVATAVADSFGVLPL